MQPVKGAIETTMAVRWRAMPNAGLLSTRGLYVRFIIDPSTRYDARPDGNAGRQSTARYSARAGHCNSSQMPMIPTSTCKVLRCAAISACAFALATASCSIPRWPVHGTITSPWGLRMRGILPELHEGVDIQVAEGTPVAAMKDGVVGYTGTLGGYGLTVILEHGPRLRTLYGHLSRIDVQVGQRVEGRAVIGRSGQTGNASAPHLHFEVIRWGRPEDPVPLLGGWPGETTPRPPP
jgi:murein DD-endopeptidase MepM/ murein hydrolase activator NlpD